MGAENEAREAAHTIFMTEQESGNYPTLFTLNAAIDAYLAKLSAWRPIETAPKDGTFTLAYIRGVMNVRTHSVQIINWSGWGGGVWAPHSGHSGGISGEPTHWQPLPSPPTETADPSRKPQPTQGT